MCPRSTDGVVHGNEAYRDPLRIVILRANVPAGGYPATGPTTRVTNVSAGSDAHGTWQSHLRCRVPAVVDPRRLPPNQ